ncbi:hypothetical protein [Streptosporangium sp. H16]|uniref:hypothetical protein n=1 Tax=Streptosporangium sp. H16 TaxID=3444184 RepID=UPI003F7916D0
MLSRADADAARAAKQVQRYAPTWWVSWSLRFRRFEAWECTDPAQCRIVCADSAADLWDDMQQVDLLIGTRLTGWTDHKGEFFTWGAVHVKEPAEHARVDDVPQVTRQIAEQLGEHCTEPTAAP